MRLVDHTECHYVGSELGEFDYYMRQYLSREDLEDPVRWYAVIESGAFYTKSLRQLGKQGLEDKLEHEFQKSDINATLE